MPPGHSRRGLGRYPQRPERHHLTQTNPAALMQSKHLLQERDRLLELVPQHRRTAHPRNIRVKPAHVGLCT